jgi:O-antigen/teichoic acid export membrane protein
MITVPRPRRAPRELGRFDRAAAATEEERAGQRRQRVVLATAAGIGSRGLTALSLLVALPLVVDRLDASSAGVWTLLVTALALLGFADLGLGNGLVNRLSDAVGRQDHPAAVRTVSTGAAALAAISAAGIPLAALAVLAVPWESVLRLGSGEVPSLRAAVATFLLAVVAGVPAGLGQRIHLAYQQSWAASATSAAGSVLALAAVLVAWVADAGLPAFVGAMLLPPVAAAAAETAWVLGRSHRDLRPRRSHLERAALGGLVRAGGLFFVLALAGAAAYQSDSFVVARYLGPEEVTSFGATLRLFLVAPALAAAVLLPLWPAYSEAIGRGDHAWVRSTLRRSLLLSAVGVAVPSAALVLLARPLLSVWAGSIPAPSTSLLLAMGAWSVVSTASMALAMWFNGTGVVRLQVVLSLVMATSNLWLSISVVDRWGAAGPVWASVVTQTAVILVPELLVVRRRLAAGQAIARA